MRWKSFGKMDSSQVVKMIKNSKVRHHFGRQFGGKVANCRRKIYRKSENFANFPDPE